MIDIEDEVDDESYSVLETHHKKNRTIRPPDPHSLGHKKQLEATSSAQAHPVSKQQSLTPAAHPSTGSASGPRRTTQSSASTPSTHGVAPKFLSRPRAAQALGGAPHNHTPQSFSRSSHGAQSPPHRDQPSSQFHGNIRSGSTRDTNTNDNATHGAQPPPHRDQPLSQFHGNSNIGLGNTRDTSTNDNTRIDNATHVAQPPPHPAQPSSQFPRNIRLGNTRNITNTNNDQETHNGHVTDADNADDSDDSSDTNVRVQRRSNLNTAPLPTQLRFYSGCWVDVLKEAKYQYRLHIHTEDPFPERTRESLADAHECLVEAIAKFQQEVKLELDEGLLSFFFHRN